MVQSPLLGGSCADLPLRQGFSSACQRRSCVRNAPNCYDSVALTTVRTTGWYRNSRGYQGIDLNESPFLSVVVSVDCVVHAGHRAAVKFRKDRVRRLYGLKHRAERQRELSAGGRVFGVGQEPNVEAALVKVRQDLAISRTVIQFRQSSA